MNDRLLVLDTETGGLDPNRFSILSLGAVIWDNGVLGQEIDLPIAEASMVTDPQSLAINQIDPKKHLINAIPVDQAIPRFIGYLKDNFPALAQGEKITLVGHNVAFDMGFLRRFFRLGNVRFEDYFSHRTVDTATILKFLMLAGRVTLDSPSSTTAFDYFGVKISQRHTALADAKATAELLNAMLILIKA
ncbi:DNA polymerase III PolC-type [mine drainage metagenome]|uniref:DNA polymerase III PolC-type n=1 Tax=mine drainage metagenome TaxID=410659 RepID=A0A1J5T0K1_9ZZZZ